MMRSVWQAIMWLERLARREDNYSEGVLLWLDVDARLRALTGDRESIDQFAKRFFNAARPDGVISTYTFDNVCQTLDSIAHDDWHTAHNVCGNNIAIEFFES